MINQVASGVSDVSSIPSVRSRCQSIAPPETKDEWFEREHITEWPFISQDPPKANTITTITESVENLEEDLKKHARYDSNFLDSVGRKLEDLEINVAYLTEFFLTDTERPIKPSTSGGLSNLPKHAFLQQLFDAKALEKATLGDKEVNIQVDEKRTVENVVFPGFSSELLTVPLPYQLEALQILDLVTRSQNFPKSLVKAWKKSYYSEASIAVFQNAFWWICMEKYKPDEKLQAGLFNQLSESFLLLFMNVSQRHKDEFFKWYPVCLGQAIYSAFCHSFPDSHKTFTDDLRQYISSTILEWTIGIRGAICSWMQWPLEAIDPYFYVGNEQDEKNVSGSSSTEKDILQTLKREASPLKSAVSFKSTAKREGTALKPLKSTEDKLPRSHSIGPGPTYERVQFNMTGRSPLIQHFMSVHHLCDESSANYQTGPTLTRTEVRALSYKQVMLRFQNEADQKYQEYERNMLRSHHEIAMAQQRHRRLQNQMERLNKEILSKKNEVKLLSEKLVNRKPDFTARRIKKTLAENK